MEQPSNHRLQPGGTERERYLWVRDQIAPGSRVFDVGCNCGQLAENLTQDLGCEVVGVDITPEFIDHCQQEKKDFGEFFCRDFGQMSSWDLARMGLVRFHVVTALELIEHPINIRRFRENVAWLLVPGGRLIITTPHPASPIVGYEFLHSYEPHVRMWTRWRLETVFGPPVRYTEINRDCGTLLSIGATFLRGEDWTR